MTKYLTVVFVSATLFAQPILTAEFAGENWFTKFNQFKPAPYFEGKDRASLVVDAETKRSVLKVIYPAANFGNAKTGAQWKTYLDKTYEHLTLTYRVKFGPDFDFVKGGKLPGLVGGSRPGKPNTVVSGGYKPNGNDGWSARIMWRKNGKVVQYVYHVDQPTRYGEDFDWKIDGKEVCFKPGTWHTVKTEIILNTPQKKDGIVRSWFDGKLALEKRDLRFRNLPTIGIDTLYFSTFFGGSDATWSTKKNETAYFDGVLVETP